MQQSIIKEAEDLFLLILFNAIITVDDLYLAAVLQLKKITWCHRSQLEEGVLAADNFHFFVLLFHSSSGCVLSKL